jgi:sugar phosphate isomerase/epimerase
MIPRLQALKVRLCFENLPSWEGIPSELEMEQLLTRFNTPEVRYWHDLGHAQVRQNLGFISHRRWLEKLRPWTVGMHIHDVAPPAHDHLMPPEGAIDFAAFKPFVGEDLLLVLEPMPAMPAERITEGLRIIREAWEDAPTPAPSE